MARRTMPDDRREQLLPETLAQEADTAVNVSRSAHNNGLSDGPSGAPVKTSSEHDDEEEPPYSIRNELRFFFARGLPLCVAAFLEWGGPPLVAMFFAGSTPDSQALQSALGYGRVYFNCTVLIALIGMAAYGWAVVPGCIGAGRRERIPHYFRRAMILSTLILLPLFALQFAAEALMRSLSVPPSIAYDVGVYCRSMICGAWLLLFECHLEIVFVCCGYSRCASFNSLLTGIGVDIGASYLLIYRWNMGVTGAALAWTVVRAARIIVWLCMAVYFGMIPLIFMPKGKERIFSASEMRCFFSLAMPQIANNMAGWLIFELQVIGLSNIQGISSAELAAGAIWVQCEQAFAAAQSGWIQVTTMRTLALLGKRDAHAGRAFALILLLSSAAVAASNAALYAQRAAIVRLASNNAAVRAAFEKIVWVLVPHIQTRLLALASCSLLIPLGRPILNVAATFACFYLIACPTVGALAILDVANLSVAVRMMLCLGTTSIAQAPLALFGLGFCANLDWVSAGKVVSSRANNDKMAIACVAADQEQAVAGPPLCITDGSRGGDDAS